MRRSAVLCEVLCEVGEVEFSLLCVCVCRLAKIGKHHPDLVVETSTLSSVPPPDITYSLSLPSSVADKGSLSALQLEAIIYACQVCDSTGGILGGSA